MRVHVTWLIIATVVGCGQKHVDDTSRPKPGSESQSPSSHSHEKGKMQVADAGRYHALLTAHLSKDGHELDLFFETAGQTPEPVALPFASLKASIQVRAGEGELREIEFVPVSVAEQPAGQPAGQYSHFVAKVPWMNPDVPHRVIIRAAIDGKDEEIRWNNFLPRKFAHHSD
jgi:hypothetical protein